MGKAYYTQKKYKLSEQSFLQALDLNRTLPLGLQGLLSLRNLVINSLVQRSSAAFMRVIDEISWDMEYSKATDIFCAASEKMYMCLEKKKNQRVPVDEIKREIQEYIIVSTKTYVALMNLGMDSFSFLKTLSEYNELLIKTHQFFFNY
jgi:hypothetical protein